MEKIKHLSIRKTIVLYMVITLFLSYVLSYFVMKGAASRQQHIWEKYMDKQYFEEIEKIGEEYEKHREDYIPKAPMQVVRPYDTEMSRTDWRISELCDFLQTYSILVFSMIGTVFAVFLFYRNKLKVPLEKLMSASAAIGNNDLDFVLEYDRKDEMGRLCAEFEMMRKQLAENNNRMWQMVENEKALRASIAHDIRSPLAVLKGYQEMLSDLLAVPSTDQWEITEKTEIEEETQSAGKTAIAEKTEITEKIKKVGTPETAGTSERTEKGEKIGRVEFVGDKTVQIEDMLSEEAAQIKRMEDFLDTMKKLSSLEERKVMTRKVPLSALVIKYQRSMEILAKKSGKECTLLRKGEKESIGIDEEMVTEVVENLLTNALRYARERVEVMLSVKETELWIEVQDDGQGFVEDKETLTKAFYHANPQDDLTHFGMGLYLSRIYCEKHGGYLLLGNGEDGGGRAVAVFGLE